MVLNKGQNKPTINNGGDMTDTQQNGTAKKILKGTGRVVLAPFRAAGQSGRLTKQQFSETVRTGKGTFSDASDAIRQNWKAANKKGRNDQFYDIFGGPDGEDLRQQNLKRFLTRKRIIIALMSLSLIYGLYIVVQESYFGLLTILSAFIMGSAFSLDAQFRLWQLRNCRLSVEEKGSFINFCKESSILDVFNPELFRGNKNGS